MAPQKSYQSYFLRIDPSRRKIDDPILEQLTRCIVSSVKERERRYDELSRRNAELQSALNQANRRIAHLEQLAVWDRDRYEAALKATSHLLARVEEAVSSICANKDLIDTLGRLTDQLERVASTLPKGPQDRIDRDIQPEAGYSALHRLAQETGTEAGREPSAKGNVDAPLIDALGDEPEMPAVPLIAEPERPADADAGPAAINAADDRSAANPDDTDTPLTVPVIAAAPLPAASIALTVFPFGSFRTAGLFQNALEALEGVRSVKVRHFHQGTLYEVVQYDGDIPFEDRLKELVPFRPQVVAIGAGSIEVRVETDVRIELDGDGDTA